MAKSIIYRPEYDFYIDRDFKFKIDKPIFKDYPAFYKSEIGGTINMAKTVSADEISVGDVINVVHESQTVTAVNKNGGEVLIETRNGKTVWPTVNGNAPTRFELVKKAKQKPASWPPRYNDVWKAGHEWGGAYYYHVDQNGKMRYGGFTSGASADTVLENYGKVELVFRPKD